MAWSAMDYSCVTHVLRHNIWLIFNNNAPCTALRGRLRLSLAHSGRTRSLRSSSFNSRSLQDDFGAIVQLSPEQPLCLLAEGVGTLPHEPSKRSRTALAIKLRASYCRVIDITLYA
eukprot:5386843-Amphidinium_carterae.4